CLYFLRRAARVLIFDFDDAIFLRDSYSPKGLHSLRRLQRFAATVESADKVVAGNAGLRDQAARWTAPERIEVMPACLDAAAYPLAEPGHGDEGVELVWIGSASTLQGLAAIQPVLERLGQHDPGLRLKLICDRFLTLRTLPVVRCRWSQAGEAAALAEADIGISWI